MDYQKQNKIYFNPVKVIKTKNWAKEIKKILGDQEENTPLIITSKGNYQRIEIKKKFPSSPIINDVPPNPTIEYCDQKLNNLKNAKVNSIIAIGGGSVMDAAKVFIAALNMNNRSTLELIKHKGEIGNNIISIFIPTTHGTGSEVTMWGTIWDMKNKIKYSISHQDLYPNYAILDYNLTKSLPEDLSIITTMDALSHSLESIWNVNRNDISTSYAIEAIVLIIKHYNSYINKSSSNDSRETLLYASTLAGLAFSNTKTAVAHSISYPLTMEYNMPHGIASSITLIPILILSEKEIRNELNKLYTKLGINTLEEFISQIKSIYNEKLNYRLRDWGVDKKDLSSLVKKCYTKDRIENYIVNINENNMLEILQEIY